MTMVDGKMEWRGGGSRAPVNIHTHTSAGAETENAPDAARCSQPRRHAPPRLHTYAPLSLSLYPFLPSFIFLTLFPALRLIFLLSPVPPLPLLAR